MEIQHCDFYDPQNSLGETPSSTIEAFQFSHSDCVVVDDRFETIEATEASTTQFILDKSVSLGDFVIISFIFLFLVFSIVKFCFDWFVPKKLDWKKH